MTETMTSAQVMAIEHACSRLVANYANLHDSGAWEAVGALFTAEARYARPTAPDVWIEGREAIVASLAGRPPRKGRHICANTVITVVDAGQATGVTAIALFTQGNAPLVGSFYDRFCLTAAGWQFSERRGVLSF